MDCRPVGLPTAIGRAAVRIWHFKLYAPWAIFAWEYWYSSYAPRSFEDALLICAVGPLGRSRRHDCLCGVDGAQGARCDHPRHGALGEPQGVRKPQGS